MKDLTAVSVLLVLATALLISPSVSGQQLPSAVVVEAPSTKTPAALPVDLQVRVLMSQRGLERARADALRAFADLIKTSIGLSWLNAEGEVRNRMLELTTVEAKAKDFCASFPGMIYDAELAQCSIPSVASKLRAEPSGEEK